MSMFDTATTAFSYHSSSAQSAKSLFSHINLPSALSTQLISSSLVMLPLGGYFGQQEKSTLKQDTSVLDTTNNNSSPPTAPQQPTYSPPSTSSKRSLRRPTVNQKQLPQNPLSTVITPASEVANMGNFLTANKITIDNSVTTAPMSPTLTGSHTHRKKKQSDKLNRKQIDQAIAFSAFAVEEDHLGNPDCALDLYLLGLDHMLKALPIYADQSRKDALKTKLRDFMDRAGLTEELMETNLKSIDSNYRNVKEGSSGPGISQHIIQAAITGAVALKQSPIPDAISATVNYTMRKIRNIDETYGLQDKAWEISRTGINFALEIDQQYNVHEKVGNALFTGLAAAMKAGIAYKDSPSYRELKKMQAAYEITPAIADGNK